MAMMVTQDQQNQLVPLGLKDQQEQMEMTAIMVQLDHQDLQNLQDHLELMVGATCKVGCTSKGIENIPQLSAGAVESQHDSGFSLGYGKTSSPMNLCSPRLTQPSFFVPIKRCQPAEIIHWERL